jgi:23S rRNA (uracil1939-C5)-methyltransferase
VETELVIERVVPGGAGLARVDGRVALVEGALPGDRVRVNLVESGARLFHGEVIEVLEAGPSRRAEGNVCPRAVDRSCGGCDWPAVRPERAGELKTALVLDALRRVGKLDVASLPKPRFVSSPAGYRLRNRLHLANGRLGFFAPKSHDIADLETCELVSPALLARLPELRGAFETEPDLVAEVVTLESRSGDELLLEVHPEAPYRDAKGLVERLGARSSGVMLRASDGRVVARMGAGALVLEAGGARFRVSVSSFFQGNRHLLDAFLAEIREMLDESGPAPGAPALDLYAGVGFLTRPLLERGLDVTAVEVEASAAADLAHNLAAWAKEGLPSAHAVEATAEGFLSRRKGTAELVLADPPRAGLSPAVRRALLRNLPRTLLLVSCDPATLARDLAELVPRYEPRRITLLDLFPSTHHVETLVHLARRG